MGKVKDAIVAWPHQPKPTENPCVIDLEKSDPMPLSPNPSDLLSFFPQPIPSLPKQVMTFPCFTQPPSSQKPKPTPFAIHPPMYSLSPLNGGGFIYNFPILPHTQAASATTIQPPISFLQPRTEQEFSKREAKLEKYRQKRAKRNYNRPVDTVKSERAKERSRIPSGQFATEKKKKNELDEVRNRLENSEKESRFLRDKLSAVEQELALLRQRAEDAQLSKSTLQKQLEEQHKINMELVRSLNQSLWQTVPPNEVFNTIRPGNPFGDAFTEAVNLNTVELNSTDSPFLEAARLEDLEFEKRWEEMTYIAEARS